MTNNDAYLSIGSETHDLILFRNAAIRTYEIYQNVPKNELIENMLNEYFDENNSKKEKAMSDMFTSIPLEQVMFASRFTDMEDIDKTHMPDEQKVSTKKIKEMDDYLDERDDLKKRIFHFLKDYKLVACNKSVYDACQYKLSQPHKSNLFSN
jgi:hypothetical protein